MLNGNRSCTCPQSFPPGTVQTNLRPRSHCSRREGNSKSHTPDFSHQAAAAGHSGKYRQTKVTESGLGVPAIRRRGHHPIHRKLFRCLRTRLFLSNQPKLRCGKSRSVQVSVNLPMRRYLYRYKKLPDQTPARSTPSRRSLFAVPLEKRAWRSVRWMGPAR